MDHHGQSVRLWAFQGNGRTIWCVLQHRAPYGVEAQVFVDGALREGRRFETTDLAVQWADMERESTAQIYSGKMEGLEQFSVLSSEF